MPMTKNRIYIQNQVWFEAFFVMIAFAYVGYIPLKILAGFEITLRQLFGILIRFKIIRKHVSTQNHFMCFSPKILH